MPAFFYVAQTRAWHSGMRTAIPVADGRLRHRQYLTPTSSWAEVTFSGLQRTGADILNISNNGPENLLVFFGDAEPGAGAFVEWHLLPNTDRDLGLSPEDRVWFRSAASWS